MRITQLMKRFDPINLQGSLPFFQRDYLRIVDLSQLKAVCYLKRCISGVFEKTDSNELDYSLIRTREHEAIQRNVFRIEAPKLLVNFQMELGGSKRLFN